MRSLKTTRFSQLHLLLFGLASSLVGLFIYLSHAAPNPNLPGDLNNDGRVDGADLAFLASVWKTNSASADLNGDSIVNGADLSILLTHYGQTVSGGGSSSFRVGVIGNVAGWGTPMQQNVLDIGSKLIREDVGDFALSWANSHGITDICIIGMSATSGGTACPIVELDNEPYNSSTWDISGWAQTAMSVAQQVKAAHPSAKILLPVGPPWNNGNVMVNGQWVDCVLAINNAAPGIWQYIDGIAIHPYSQPAGPVPGRFPVLDKWRSNLKAIGHDIPFWVTEVGWPTGGINWPPAQTEQQQADYIGQFIDAAKARGDIRAVLVYDLQDYGPRDSNSEHWFGLLHVDFTKKPSWSVVQQRILANP